MCERNVHVGALRAMEGCGVCSKLACFHLSEAEASIAGIRALRVWPVNRILLSIPLLALPALPLSAPATPDSGRLHAKEHTCRGSRRRHFQAFATSVIAVSTTID